MWPVLSLFCLPAFSSRTRAGGPSVSSLCQPVTCLKVQEQSGELRASPMLSSCWDLRVWKVFLERQDLVCLHA